ncbi:MAG: hypothetical protein HZA93_03635 [Verrucomicrobia bacterium]|nr:hypothetical protein [Verrucomicrobiota bacterium]
MDPRPIYFVRLAAGVRGPMAVEHLRDLADAGFVTREHEIALSADGPWTPLAGQAICAEVFPARRAIAFKDAQIVPVSDAPVATLDPNRAIEEANRPPPSFRGREVFVTARGLLGTPDSGKPNEVQAMVQEVHARVAAHAPPPPPPPPPPPKFPRWRWFVAASLLGTAGIMGIPLLYEMRYDSTSVAILLFWTALYNAFVGTVMMVDRAHNAWLRTRALAGEKTDD